MKENQNNTQIFSEAGNSFVLASMDIKKLHIKMHKKD